MKLHAFFHTVVVVGMGMSSGCAESHDDNGVEAGANEAGTSSDAAIESSTDAASLADRIIEDANQMMNVKDAAPDAYCDEISKDGDCIVYIR